VVFAKADGWRARVDVVPVVVVVGDAEVSGVFNTVGVGVADQRCLPVVMGEGVGDRDIVWAWVRSISPS
jgi:hypothetical protein